MILRRIAERTFRESGDVERNSQIKARQHRETRPDEPGVFAGRVLGVLDDDHCIPIPGALVRLFHGDEEVRRAYTNWHDVFTMPEVPPRLYVAIAAKSGWLPGEAEVEIRPGEVTYHVFLLDRSVQPSPSP